MLYYCNYNSPLGEMTLMSDGCSLIGVWFVGQRHYPQYDFSNLVCKQDAILQYTQSWLDSYFSGKNPGLFAIPLNPAGTEFQKLVWSNLLNVSYGSSISYGQIADFVRVQKGCDKMAARAVGAAVGRNPISIIIPCHRVMGRHGTLTGYAGGLTIKAQLLNIENICFVE